MSELVGEMRLTDEAFWAQFWAPVRIPARVNRLASFDRCMSRVFRRFLADGEGKTLIEIGAAPGRWLVYFREKMGYAVDGIEYIPSSCRKTEENLAACGTDGRIFQQDFFQNDLPRHSYDVVLSLGFIEHFTDPGPAVEGHVALLKPGGLLVMGVPNLRGLHGAVERLTDRETLAAHNTDVMSVPFLQGLAGRHELVPLWAGHVGGPSPGLISVADAPPAGADGVTARLRHRGVLFLRLVLRLLRYVRSALPPLDYLNGPLFSSYLVAVYRYTPRNEEWREERKEARSDEAAREVGVLQRA